MHLGSSGTLLLYHILLRYGIVFGKKFEKAIQNLPVQLL